MSITREREGYATKEELVEYLRRRIEALEEELRVLKSLLAMIDPSSVEGAETVDPSERVEDVKVSKRVIAKLGMGEDYVRIKLLFPTPLPGDVKQYLETVLEEIGEKQAIRGVPPEERAAMEIVPSPDGGVRMIRVYNLSSTLEKVRVKAALKYVAELLYKIYRKRES